MKSAALANTEFQTAIADLKQANAAFAAGTLKSVQHGDARENAICRAVMALAGVMGADIEPVNYFTSRAEVRIVGNYSEDFARALNAHANPRTGVLPGAVMTAGQSWCYVNHFDAERLILAYA